MISKVNEFPVLTLTSKHTEPFPSFLQPRQEEMKLATFLLLFFYLLFIQSIVPISNARKLPSSVTAHVIGESVVLLVS